MKCPYCGHIESRVLESRSTEENLAIRRRRACQNCEARFTTYERVETLPLFVIKKDKRREPYNREKILAGILKACEKRPIPLSRLEEIVNNIETELRNRLEPEISTEVIGELVMDELRKLDQVAYVRFASVYRRFHDLNRFKEELDLLLKDSNQ
jgi:transcriptional repressor NrdR